MKMQQQELAQMRQRDANLTALAAIGPRKKRKVDCAGPGSGAEVQQEEHGAEGPGGRFRMPSSVSSRAPGLCFTLWKPDIQVTLFVHFTWAKTCVHMLSLTCCLWWGSDQLLKSMGQNSDQCEVTWRSCDLRKVSLVFLSPKVECLSFHPNFPLNYCHLNLGRVIASLCIYTWLSSLLPFLLQRIQGLYITSPGGLEAGWAGVRFWSTCLLLFASCSAMSQCDWL